MSLRTRRHEAAGHDTDEVPPPTLTAVLPDNGPALTAETVIVTGTGLTGATGLDIGGPCLPFAVMADDHVSGTLAPTVDVGVYDVTVHHPRGDVTLSAAYTAT